MASRLRLLSLDSHLPESVVLNLLHSEHSGADAATADSAALHGAKEDELHDEHHLERVTVHCESRVGRSSGLGSVCNIEVGDVADVFVADGSEIVVNTDGREDGASEEGSSEAGDAASSQLDSQRWDAGDDYAAEHQDGDDHEDHEDDGVVLKGSGPASGGLIGLTLSDPVNWGITALVVPVVALSLSVGIILFKATKR